MSSSLVDLFQNTQYEGHPCLWYVVLFLTNRVTSNPLGMPTWIRQRGVKVDFLVASWKYLPGGYYADPYGQ